MARKTLNYTQKNLKSTFFNLPNDRFRPPVGGFSRMKPLTGLRFVLNCFKFVLTTNQNPHSQEGMRLSGLQIVLTDFYPPSTQR
jgi:hypothetical protein